jgi:hypothetical protein
MQLLDQIEPREERENDDALDAIKARSRQLAEFRRRERVALLEDAAQLRVDPGAAVRVLKGLRWFDAVGYHAWRATHHLMNGDSPHGRQFKTEARQDPGVLDLDE